MEKKTLVICPFCFQSSHELTDKYDPTIPVNGTMIRLSEPYRSWGWETHGEDDTGQKEGDILCGHCGGQLVRENVVVTEEQYLDQTGTPAEEKVKKKRRKRKK